MKHVITGTVLVILLLVGVAAAAVPMPDLSFMREAAEIPIDLCPEVIRVTYEQPGHEDSPAYDAYAWFKAPDRSRPFFVRLQDDQTGDATWYFVDLNRDGVADKQAKNFEELGLPDSACELARLVR